MRERTDGFRRLLEAAGAYSFTQRALGANNVRRTFVRDYLRPLPGERILDLGCGPGDILDLLPAVDYLGIDNSDAYIAAARRRFGLRATFVCADIRALALDADRGFDAVISIGVLHHLDDAEAARMIEIAAHWLAPRGRLVTIDPGYAEPQSRVARWLIERDRGRAVRGPEGYRRIVEDEFESVTASVHHQLARLPYTHVVVQARGPYASRPHVQSGERL